MRSALALCLLALFGCTEQKPAEPLSALKPKPLPTLTLPAADDREALHTVEPAPVFGEKVPVEALRLELSGEVARLGGESFGLERPEEARRLAARLGSEPRVLLATDAETYLAQVIALLSALDDARAEVSLLHPSGGAAYRVRLEDEAGFQAWLDEPTPGRIRVIQRADGFELQTAVGKLPGPDPNGPSVPVRGGQQDVATLREGLQRLNERFTQTEDLCFVPSLGTELSRVAEAMSGNYAEMGEPFFEQLCLVYRRPPAK